MDFLSFLLSLITWLTTFLILILLFTWLSRKPENKVVYYTKRIINGAESSEKGCPTRNKVSWIREALRSSERDVVSASGVDSAVYFVFLTTVLKILVVSGVVILPLLLPLAATESIYRSSVGTFNRLDRLSLAPVEQKTTRLWAFVAATYWVSIVAYFMLWKAYKHVSDMRAAALVSPGFRPEQFAILVRDIPLPPKGQTRKEQVDSYFRNIYPDTFYKSLVVTGNIKKVNIVYKKLEDCEKKLSCAEASKKIQYNDKINELVLKLEAEKKPTSPENQQPAALVFFTSRVTAAAVAQNLQDRIPDKWTVTDAPAPSQIIWPNLSKTLHKIQIRKILVCVVIFFTIIFYMGLVGVSSAFSIASIGNGVAKTVIRAYVPHLVLIVSIELLSKFLFILSKAEGISSKSEVARSVCIKFFYFTALNFFTGFTLFGTFFESLRAINHEQYNTYTEVLGESLPTNAIFFMTFIALKCFVGYGLELSRIFPLISFHLKRKRHCKTGDELKEAWAPGEFGFENRIFGDMLIVTIAIGYSVIAPIMIPFGVVYFGLGWLVLRNQVLNVYVPSHETYGKMWPCINTQIVAALVVFQTTMCICFGLKSSFTSLIFFLIVIPLPVISILFDCVCRRKYYKLFKNMALEAASSELNETPNMELIFRSYIPPSLKADEDHLKGSLSQV